MRTYVSFDFDGVLHIEMVPNTIHPNVWSWIDGESPMPRPRLQYHQILKKEAQQHAIIITSSRCEDSREDIEEFVRHYRLPVEDIYLTCMEPKIRLFQELEEQGIIVIRHYDDDPGISRQIMVYQSDIQFIKVPFVTREMALESVDFKEFFQPNKSKGHIDREGNIHYYESPTGWIKFKRTNLEGSLRNSFWHVEVPVLNSNAKEALRIWALNMPEHYADEVIVKNKTTTVENIANFKL